MGLAGLMALGLVQGTPGAARAEVLEIPADMRVGASNRIDLELAGVIAPQCRLGEGTDVELGELRGGEAVELRFALDCNLPFNINVRSLRGGLAHAASPQGQGPYAGLLEYDLKLSMPTRSPAPGMMEGVFTSRQLLAQATLSSGNAIASGYGTLGFKMKHPTGAGLLAGRYSETLTLTVAPAI